jgi:hypothetical protein
MSKRRSKDEEPISRSGRSFRDKTVSELLTMWLFDINPAEIRNHLKWRAERAQYTPVKLRFAAFISDSLNKERSDTNSNTEALVDPLDEDYVFGTGEKQAHMRLRNVYRYMHIKFGFPKLSNWRDRDTCRVLNIDGKGMLLKWDAMMEEIDKVFVSEAEKYARPIKLSSVTLHYPPGTGMLTEDIPPREVFETYKPFVEKWAGLDKVVSIKNRVRR